MAQENSIFLHQSFDTDAQARVSVAKYHADEVIRHFLALYNCMDFKILLEELGIGRFQFLRRKKALRECRALCMALWDLALQKSFPDDAGEFFSAFREQAPDLTGAGREPSRLRTRVDTYIELLAAKKDADFLPVADYMARELAMDKADMPRLRLKLSLLIRRLYVLIFQKLV